MDKFKKALKYTAAFCIPFLMTAICFGLVWFQFLRDVPLKSESYYLNDRYDSLTSPLTDGSVFTQEFTARTSLYGIGLNFNVVDSSLDGEIRIGLKDTETGAVLLDYSGNLAAASPAGYSIFTLDTPVTENSKHNYELSVQVDYHTPQVSPGQMLSLKKSSKTAFDFGVFRENGTPAEGSVAVIAVKDMLGASPVKYYGFAGLLCSFAAGILILIFTAFPNKKLLAVFLTVFFSCTMYHMALPVFSAPDEETHFNTAYGVSNFLLGREQNHWYEVQEKRNCDRNDILTDYKTSAFTYRYIADNIFRPNNENDSRTSTLYTPMLDDSKTPFLLPGLFITICRIFNLNGVVTAMGARAMNLILFSVAVTLAWYIIPFAKNGLLAIALLPMAIHIGSSLSYDSFILCISFLIIALVMKFTFSEEKFSGKKAVALTIICILLTPVKLIYSCLLLLILLIPKSKFSSVKNKYKYFVCLVIASYIFYSFFNDTLLNRYLISPVSLALFPVKDSPWIFEALTNAGMEELPAAIENFTIGYILSHPGITFKVLVNTLFTKFNFYFGTIFGATLGYLNLADISINPIIIAAFIIVLLIAYIPHKDDTILNIPQRVFTFGIFAALTAMVAGACILWTPLDYDFIWGFQGRYLLPVLPLFMLSVQPKTVTLSKDITPVLLGSLFGLNILTVLNIFIVVFSR